MDDEDDSDESEEQQLGGRAADTEEDWASFRTTVMADSVAEKGTVDVSRRIRGKRAPTAWEAATAEEAAAGARRVVPAAVPLAAAASAAAAAPPPLADGSDEIAEQTAELPPPVELRRPPPKPCDAEVRRHNILHLPYKPWCEVCGLRRKAAEIRDLLRRLRLWKKASDRRWKWI